MSATGVAALQHGAPYPFVKGTTKAHDRDSALARFGPKRSEPGAGNTEPALCLNPMPEVTGVADGTGPFEVKVEEPGRFSLGAEFKVSVSLKSDAPAGPLLRSGPIFPVRFSPSRPNATRHALCQNGWGTCLDVSLEQFNATQASDPMGRGVSPAKSP